MELDLYQMQAEEQMEKSINLYISDISKISTGRANPNILNFVKVIYYDSLTNIKDISNISIPEPRQLLIAPFDKNITKDIVCAIEKNNLGVSISNEGDKIRITFPILTTEKRKELVKSLSSYTEKVKISIRAVRQELNKNIKKDDELTEDEQRVFLEKIQKITNEYTLKVDSLTKEKSISLMTI